MTRHAGLLGGLLALLIAGGCGGSSASHPAAGRGRATLKVLWPSRARAIPNAANGLVVDLLKNGNPVDHKLIARPLNGETQTQTEFTDLAIDTYDVSIKAFPNADGSGVAQATGASTMTTSADAAAAVTVSLDSTVKTLKVSPTTASIAPGATTTLAVSARDADDNVVLLSAGGGTENVEWTSDAPGVATVTGSGLSATVSGVAAGTANVSASFNGLSASAALGVSAPSANLTFAMPWKTTTIPYTSNWTGIAVRFVDRNGTIYDRTINRSSDNSPTSVTLSDVAAGAGTLSYQMIGSGPAVADGASVTLGGGTTTYTFGNAPFIKVLVGVDILTYGTTSVPVGMGFEYDAKAFYSDRTSGVITGTAVWTSSDPTIATVNAGTIVARRRGVVTITATKDGRSASVTFTVS